MPMHPLNDNTTEPDRDPALVLEGLEPASESGRRFEISWKHWLAVAQIVAASDRVDPRTVGRMFDLQPGDQFGTQAAEEIDIPLLLLLEWTERFSTSSIHISPSGLVVEDRHEHLDQTTSVFDFKWGSDDAGIDFGTLYHFRHFVLDCGGFKVDGPKPASESICESKTAPGVRPPKEIKDV